MEVGLTPILSINLGKLWSTQEWRIKKLENDYY